MLIAGLWMGLHGALSALARRPHQRRGGRGVRMGRHAQQEGTAGERAARALQGRSRQGCAHRGCSSGWCCVNYKQLVPAPFFGAFILTVIFFSMAIFVRDR